MTNSDWAPTLAFLIRTRMQHACGMRLGAAPPSRPHPLPRLMFPCATLRPSPQIKLFEAAAATAPTDPELHVALGVLHHLGRAYGPAVEAFERALQLRPGDYRWEGRAGAGAWALTRFEAREQGLARTKALR